MLSLREYMSEDLRNWFRQKWVRMDTKGNIKGDCAREPGEGKPKCLPLAKARAMDKEDRASAVRRKRREDPVADRPGKGGAPVNVKTEAVNRAQQAAIAIALIKAGKKKGKDPGPQREEVDYLEEKNTPTNPALWSRAKALARSKFDVYPSAYANGWAAKWYKSKGGGWKSVSEGTDDEGGMAKGELETIAAKAKELSKMMKKNKQLDAWVQSKITKSDDYIGSVHDYLKNSKQEVDESVIMKSFKQFREETTVCCDECMEELVEDVFTSDGTELYEDWGELDEEDNEGRKLNKPFLTPGGPKKRAVYVRNEKGNVVKVGFGDPNLSIKRDNPERRKSFRARHNCDNPGPKTKARYWSCKYWSSTPVSKLD